MNRRDALAKLVLAPFVGLMPEKEEQSVIKDRILTYTNGRELPDDTKIMILISPEVLPEARMDFDLKFFKEKVK
jgi:hypothetical protein